MSNDLVILAQRGGSLLIQVDADHAQIFDARHARLFPAQTTESALARGYWRPFAGNIVEVAQQLSVAVHMGDPQPSLLSNTQTQSAAASPAAYAA